MMPIDGHSATALLSDVRDRHPRVHCLTNHVARAFTANVLLAIGAVPSMSADESEVGDFVAGADALLVNLGTLEPSMRSAIRVATEVAIANKCPVVLDPVFAERSAARSDYARHLLGLVPCAMRCNAAEAEALGDTALSQARGRGTVIALTGREDVIQSSGDSIQITGGDPVMTRVTAMGCALGAVIAAFLTTDGERFDAVASACLLFKRAGAAAAAASGGPGSFVPAFLDTLHSAARDAALPELV